MRSTDDLRQELDAETAGLTVTIVPEQVRRRAYGIRARRMATAAAATALAVSAIAVPSVLLTSGRGPAVPLGSPPVVCPSPEPTIRVSVDDGPVLETGAILDAPDLQARFDVVVTLAGPCGYASLGVGFRDRATGAQKIWAMTGLVRDEDGNFRGELEGEPPFFFLTVQVPLGPNRVLDLGVYSGIAPRLTVASEGRESDAAIYPDARTGWTLFWVERNAAALPLEASTNGGDYSGPEQLTVTAYNPTGVPRHQVTGGRHLGHTISNPRDNTPLGDPT